MFLFKRDLDSYIHRLKRQVWNSQISRVSVPGFLYTYDFEMMLKDDPHFKLCAEVLEQYAPESLASLYHGLINEVKALKHSGETLRELEIETANVRKSMSESDVKVKSTTRSIFGRYLQNFFLSISKTPEGLFHKLRVSIYSSCLSLMLTLGLFQLFDVDLRDPWPELILRGAFPFCLALGVNLSTQESIKEGVLKLQNDRANASSTIHYPFWHELLRGNATLWHCLAFINFEGILASVLVFTRLPLHLKDNIPVILAVTAASTYFAYQNIVLAWSQGLREYRFRLEAQKSVEAKTATTTDDVWSNQQAAVLEIGRLKVRSRQVEDRFKRNKREYRKSYLQATKLTREWFRVLPYLLELIKAKGATEAEVHTVANIFPNDNGQTRLNTT